MNVYRHGYAHFSPKIPILNDKPNYYTSDTVRTIDIDYVCWLKLYLQFYEYLWQQMSMIWINLFIILSDTLQNPDQNHTIPWWSIKRDLFAIYKYYKVYYYEGKLCLLKSEGWFRAFAWYMERCGDYVISLKGKSHLKTAERYTKRSQPDCCQCTREPNYWYLEVFSFQVTEKIILEMIPSIKIVVVLVKI